MFNQKNELDYENLQFLLNLWVSSGNCEETQELLTEYSDKINAADDFGMDGEEGRLLGFGFTTSPKMLKLLIDNYVETVIEKQETTQGKMVKKKLLSEMLKRQLDETGNEYGWLSDEYKKLLAPWLPKDEDSESEQDLEGFDVYNPMAAEDLSQMSDGGAEDFGQDHSSSPRTPIEFPEDSANPDSCDYSDILRQENSPMLEAVRQNLDAHGFRLPDEIITLDDAIVALEKISSGLGYVYSGRDYETNKEFIERQITDIKLSASAAADVGRFSRLVGSAEDLPQDVIAAHSVKTPEVFSPHYDSPINDQAPGSELIGEA